MLPLSSLPSFSLTPANPVSCLHLQSPYKMIFFFFWTTSSSRAEANPVWHRVDPNNEFASIKEERKEEKEGKIASLLEFVTLRNWRKFGVHRTAGNCTLECWESSTLGFPSWNHLLRAANLSLIFCPGACWQLIFVWLTGGWGPRLFTWDSQNIAFQATFLSPRYTSD